MCGIVGYIGKGKALPILIDGLSKLEYRGYDSAGVAFLSEGSMQVYKAQGKLINLVNELNTNETTATIGIGHTRWATHGEPSSINAHPHCNEEQSIAVVHNGIIENYQSIKQFLLDTCKIEIKSSTDTEVIAHLISYYYKGDILTALKSAVEMMEGAYAIGVLCVDEPDRLVAVRKDSPLIVGVGHEQNFIASDIPAILKYTKDILFLENDEYVELLKNDVILYDAMLNKIDRDIYKVTFDVESAKKEGYEHFTLKEIHEQPKAMLNTIHANSIAGVISLEHVTITKEDLENINQIYIIGCGTAYHAGLIGRYVLKEFANCKVNLDIASEFRYNDPFIDEHTLVIVVSQSGETLDTLQSMRLAKQKGARVLSIVNVVGSSMTRESDDVFYTVAGPEIGVASTKVFTCQLTAFYMLGLYFGKLKGILKQQDVEEVLNTLISIPNHMEKILKDCTLIEGIAMQYYNHCLVFFMGRNKDSDIAYEASLKLKEISYINSLAIAAGELKHGTIALIEPGALVVSLATQDYLFEKMVSNIREVKSRGAQIFLIAKEGCAFKDCDSQYLIPEVDDLYTPFLSVIPMQLFAYYVSKLKGLDVDTPRNLAKSVTVE